MRSIIAFLLLSSSALAQGRQPSPPAELILFNGKVFTASAASAFAEAVAIRGERIIAVGSTDEIKQLAGPETRRIDLRGHLAVPGFNDAHFHFDPDPKSIELRFETMEPTWDEVKRKIAQASHSVPARTWIIGAVGPTVVLDKAVNRSSLDSLAPNHPVLLRAYYGHGYIVNTAAMRRLGIAEDEPDPMGGTYERDANSRRLNGRLWEYAQWKINLALARELTDEEALAALHAMADEAIRYGVTSLQVFPGIPLQRFVRLAAKAEVPVRIRAIAFPPTTAGGRDLTEIQQLGTLKASGNVRAAGIKWVLDGTPVEHGAALRTGYTDRPEERGRLNFSESELSKMLRESVQLRQQVLLHCVGDRTTAAVFDAMERQQGVDWPVQRLRIEHGDSIMDDLLPRAQKLHVVVVQNPMHFADPALGAKRWGLRFRIRSIVNAGIPFAIGSDGPMNPFLNLMFAVTHPINPSEALTMPIAVRAYTYGSAFAEFKETDKGTLETGRLADLAVLSQDIFSVVPPELPKTVTLLTIVGGRIVYDAHALD